MEYHDDFTKVSELNIAYIGGGSRGWAWGFMADLAMDDSLGGRMKLYDIDREAAEHNAVIGNRLSARGDSAGKWTYEVADSLQEALTGADFVIISILPGTFDEMESDVHTPEEYGIYQSVGDTVGPGGIIRALRTIPMFEEIGKAIKDYSPDAWVVNYTNPMTVCVKTLYRVFPEIKAFGCCHEVFGTQKLLAKALEDICGIPDVSRDQIKVNVLGINHFTWLDRAGYKGMDLFPIYREFAEKYAETGYLEKVDTNWMNNFFASAERVKLDLFLRYGLIAAAGDRHLAEFLPGSWYLKNPETVAEWKFSLTPVSYRKADLHKRLEKSRLLISGESQVTLTASGEEGLLLIKALLGLGEMVSNVNIPNRGQIENLPVGSVVETNALFSRDRIAPVMAGSLPGDVLHLVQRHVVNQDSLVQAVLERDLNRVFRVFINDPQLSGMGIPQAEELFDRMVKGSRKFLAAEFLQAAF